MEKWDLYTAGREPAGLEHIRGQEIPEGLYHLVVHVWIRSSKGEYLISRRSAERETFPLMWETVGGSVLAGEDSLTGAVREAREEVGIDLSPEVGRLLFSVTGRVTGGVRHRDILDVWLFEYDGPVPLEAAPSDEVAETRWMARDEILRLFETGGFVGNLAYFFTAEGF